MHLGLIDGRFVPHNLISTQESPVPLLKFQMAPPDLKSYGLCIQEMNPDTLFFSLKSPSKQTPFKLPNRAPMEREAHLQGILHISQKTHLSGSPVKEPSLKVPFMESLTGDAPPLEPSFIHQSKSLVHDPPPHMPGSPQMERGPHGERCPFPETFLTLSSSVPSEEAPPRAPFIQLSKSAVDEPSSRFPKRPYGKRCLSPEPFLHILQGPQQGSRPSRFPSQSSHRQKERTPPSEPLSTISQSPRFMSPRQVAQLSPHEERCPSPEPYFHNLLGPWQRRPPPPLQVPLTELP